MDADVVAHGDYMCFKFMLNHFWHKDFVFAHTMQMMVILHD